MNTVTESFPQVNARLGLSDDKGMKNGGAGQIGILDTLLLLAAQKRLVLGMTLAGTILGGALGLFLPRMYTATAVILPPQQAKSTAATILGQLGNLAGVGGADLSLKTPAELYIGILGSRTIGEAVAERFDLRRVYGAQCRSDALKKLAHRTSLSSGKDTLIRISVDDSDAKRSAAIANTYVDELYKQTARLAVTESAQRRLFFQSQLEQERAALSQAETQVKDVQERTGLFVAPSQAEVLLRSVAELRADIAAREVALENLRVGATSQNPEVQRRETELASMRSQLKRLEENPRSRAFEKVTATSQFPTAGLEHLKRVRELKYHESMFELLAKQYEAARIDEAKEAPVVQIVDSAVPPERSGGPAPSLLAVTGGVLCGFFTSLYVFIAAALRSPDRAAKAVSLRRLLLADKMAAGEEA